MASQRDVTERNALEEQLRHQAFHDPLTELPNRALFMDRLEHALAKANRRESRVAVLFLDLDNFKVVNDSLGHEAGDSLLAAVAERLKTCLRTEDTLTRFGGDEFTILLEGVGDVSEATHVAEGIIPVPILLLSLSHTTRVGAGRIFPGRLLVEGLLAPSPSRATASR